MSDLPKPQTDTDVLLLAVVQRLDRVLKVLEPAPEEPAPKPAARKRAVRQ